MEVDPMRNGNIAGVGPGKTGHVKSIEVDGWVT